MNTAVRAGAMLLVTTGCLLADVSYQEAVKYTGGSLVDMMKGMQGGLMGKMIGNRMGKALQDQTFKIYVKGNKMARIGPDTSSIIDLDAGTMTAIDNQRQAYSTTTFEEMNQRIEEMKQKMSKSGSQGGDVQFDVKVDETGNTRSIDGQTAKEYVMTLTAQGQQGAGMRVRSDMWDVTSVPGLDELRGFQKRMSEKLTNGSAGFNPMLGNASSGLSQLSKETLKIKGFPVSQDVAVTGVQGAMNPMMAMRNGGEGNSDPNAPFLVMNTSSSGFSDSSVSDSVFEIPAGYKQQRGGRH